MAETTTKRHRDAAGKPQTETLKRHRTTSCININEQQETTQYLLDFFTNPPSEPDPFLHFDPQPESDPDPNTKGEPDPFIRHLFEASDDELGIPSRVDDVTGGDNDVTGGDDDVTVGGGGFGDLWDGLWELEDEVANYYTLLQSELFMQ